MGTTEFNFLDFLTLVLIVIKHLTPNPFIFMSLSLSLGNY